MKKCIFKGCCTALVTPFDKSGNINYFSLKRLIEFQIASGINALLILGTTGESSTISAEERRKIIKFCKAEILGRVPLIVGCGSNNTLTALSYLKEAEELGVDGALVVTPYYNKCSQEGAYQHFKYLAKSTNIPIILYNVPSRTGFNLLPKTVHKLSKIKNIVAIKEASGNISQITELLYLLSNSFSVYSGDDGMTIPAMSIGAKGVISVSSNAEPELVSIMCDYAINGDYFNANKINERLFKLNRALFLDVNPICIKTYLNLLGFDIGDVRLPLSKPNSDVINKLKQIKREYEN